MRVDLSERGANNGPSASIFGLMSFQFYDSFLAFQIRFFEYSAL